jgi:hypothetical protein
LFWLSKKVIEIVGQRNNDQVWLQIKDELFELSSFNLKVF